MKHTPNPKDCTRATVRPARCAEREGRTEDPQDDVDEEMDVHSTLKEHGERGQEDGDDEQQQIDCPPHHAVRKKKKNCTW